MDHNQKKNTHSPILKTSVFLLALTSFAELSIANPQDGTVVAGGATITQQNPTTTVITQTTDKTIIDWRSFSIGAGETTRFNQPSSNSVALNRVTGNDPSAILGNLSANGKIMLINPNGIVFGKNSTVDVASLIAATANISNQDFLNDHYHFVQDSTKNFGIINNGMIKVSDTGLIALVAPSVVNNGIIQANLGKVILASGIEFTVIDTYGDKLIQFATNSKVNNATVANHGTIIADGGKVLMTAKATANVVDNVISMDGVIQARSIATRNGEVILTGGDEGVVNVNGQIDVTGKNTDEHGGKVKITGNKIGIFDNAKIDASGINGGGEILVGGDAHGSNQNVTNAKYTYVSRNAHINADAITNGNGGKVVVWADNATQFYGNISARGGSKNGNGGWIETSGKQGLLFDGFVDTSALFGKTGTLLLDPKNITIKEHGGSNYDPDTNNFFNDLASSSLKFKSSSINSQNTNVVLQANTDITVDDAIAMTKSGVTLTLQAGRDILINDDISTNNGTITLIANDPGAKLANRTSGTGDIKMKSGTTLNAGNQNINLTIGTLAGGNPGSITANNLTTNGGNILITSQNAVTLAGAINSGSGSITINANQDSSGTSNFIMNGNSSITTTNGAVAINVNTATGGKGSATLGNITTNGGSLSVTTNNGGNITQNGILNTNNITLATGNNNDITLNQNNILNNISITSARNVRIKNTAALVLNNATVNGALNINTTGKITQTGVLNVTGATTLAAGKNNDIILDKTNSLSSIGITSARHVTINNVNDLVLATSKVSGNLNVTTTNGNIINNNGAITVIGAANFNAGNHDITLSNNNNNFNTVSFIGNNVSVVDKSGLALDTSTITGNFNLTTCGDITQTGAINNTGGVASFNTQNHNITLTNTNNNFSKISTKANNANITNKNSLILDTSTISNSLTIIANGTITQTGAISANTLTTTSTGGTTLNAANSLSNFKATNTNNGDISLTNTRALTVTGIDQSGGGDVTLNNNSNTLNVNNGNTINSGNGNLNITASNLNLNTTGKLNSGIGNTTINATDNIGLGNATATMSINNTELQNITANQLTLNTNKNIIVDGISTAATQNINGLVTLNATGDSSNIIFQNNASNFKQLAANANNTVTINTNINPSSAASNLAFSGNHGITLNGIINSANDLTLSAIAGDITQTSGSIKANHLKITTQNAATLQQPNNTFNTITINNANNVVLKNNSALNFANTNISGNLTAIVNGAITQSDAIKVNGVAYLDAGSNNIDLNNSDNNFHTIGIINANNATLNNKTSLNFANSNIANTLTVTANGAITQSGTISANTLITNSKGSTTLNAANMLNNFKAINSSSGDISLTNHSALTVTGIQNDGGNIALTTNNSNIVFNNTINGAHNLTLNAGSGNIFFNKNVGDITPLNTLQITNANNVTNNAVINTANYIQITGTGITAFGNGGLNTSNTTNITTNAVTGAINVKNLTLDVIAANLTGKVDGLSGIDGANNIVLAKSILPNKQFFDGIDLLSHHTSIVDPTALKSSIHFNPAVLFPIINSYTINTYFINTPKQLLDSKLVITIAQN